MSRYNPKVFTNVDSLKDIKHDLLHQLLCRFPRFCEEQQLHLNNGVIKNEDVCRAFLNAGNSMVEDAHDLMEALQSITEMAHLGSRSVLTAMGKANGLALPEGPDVTDADFALHCWLNHQSLFTAAYAKARVKKFQSFLYYAGKTYQERTFPEITDQKTAALQAEINLWLKDNGRMPNCRVYFFPHGDRLSIVLKYGMPLIRDIAAKKDGDGEGVFYNPQKHDLLIYDRKYDEISLNTPNISDQDKTYRRSVAKYLFDDENYFEQEKTYSLVELQKITTPRNFLSAGVKRASLVEITFDRKHRREIWQASDLQSALVRHNNYESEHKPEIVAAKFKLILDRKGSPQRVVTIENGNKARLDRSEDGLVIDEWIRSQRFIKAQKNEEKGDVAMVAEPTFA